MKYPKASFSTSPRRYNVFLSFRGIDIRKTFIDHLYTALDHAGFLPFIDDDGIERGEDIMSELEKAVRETRISIVVFSKNYASSTWCLEELVMILKRRSYGHVVLPVFYDVHPAEVRHQVGSFKEAFTRYEEKLKSVTGERKEELKNKVGTWRTALREVTNLSGMNLQNHANGHEAEFIKKIIEAVGNKLHRPVLDIDPHLVGTHSQDKNIRLCSEDGPANTGVFAICGMGMEKDNLCLYGLPTEVDLPDEDWLSLVAFLSEQLLGVPLRFGAGFRFVKRERNRGKRGKAQVSTEIRCNVTDATDMATTEGSVLQIWSPNTGDYGHYSYECTFEDGL